MAEASAAVERRKASALRSARAASDDAAQNLRLPALCLPLFFWRQNASWLWSAKLGAYATGTHRRLHATINYANFAPVGEGGGRFCATESAPTRMRLRAS
jgi:hypothetical protein